MKTTDLKPVSDSVSAYVETDLSDKTLPGGFVKLLQLTKYAPTVEETDQQRKPMTLRTVYSLVAGIVVLMLLIAGTQVLYDLRNHIFGDVFWPLQLFGATFGPTPAPMWQVMLLLPFSALVWVASMFLWPLAWLKKPWLFVAASIPLVISAGTWLGDTLSASWLWQQVHDGKIPVCSVERYLVSRSRQAVYGCTDAGNMKAQYTFLNTSLGWWTPAIAMLIVVLILVLIYGFKLGSPIVMNTQEFGGLLSTGLLAFAAFKENFSLIIRGIVALTIACFFVFTIIPGDRVAVTKLVEQRRDARWGWCVAFCLWYEFFIIFLFSMWLLGGAVTLF